LDIRVDNNPDGALFDWVDDDDDNFPVMNDITGLQDAINKLKPGDSTMIIVGIKNFGSIAGLANIGLKNLRDDDNGLQEPEIAGSGELSANVDVVVSYGDKSEIGDTWDAWYDVFTGTLLEWSSVSPNVDADSAGGDTLMEAGDDDYWVVEFSINSVVGNDIMSDTATFDIEFGLVQQP